jgi:hypothetical protein
MSHRMTQTIFTTGVVTFGVFTTGGALFEDFGYGEWCGASWWSRWGGS